MKGLSKLTFIAFYVIIAQQTNAQINIGFKTGINVANINQNFEHKELEFETYSRLAYHIGVIVDYSLNEKFGIQPSVLYSSKGTNLDIKAEWGAENVDGYYRYIYNYLETPINLTYRIGSFQFMMGPYLALGVNGKNKWRITILGEKDKGKELIKPVSGEVKDGDLADNEDAFRFLDYGLNGVVGYQFGSFFINAGYAYGLGNLIPDYEGSNNENKISNKVITLSVGYFL